MLSCTRHREVRQSLRHELGAFVLRHRTNRALIFCLHTMGELSKNTGIFELEDAAAELLLDERVDDGVGSQRRDGGGDGDGDGGGLRRGGGGFAKEP